MQEVVIEKPYTFVPPHRGNWWPSFIQKFKLIDIWLRKQGVVSWECRDQHKLRESLDAGHGVMLTPNHARASDPLAMGWLARSVGTHVYAMASWHLFHQGKFIPWAIPKMGGFSINREGIDKQAINTSIEMLTSAERPLIVFPEGAVTRTNDRLQALLDGVAFIARTAAKRRQKLDPQAKVVIHPVAIKYLFLGDFALAADPLLTEIEHRFSWRPQRHLSITDRIAKVGRALLCLKEMEFFGEVRTGRFGERMKGLINRLLSPLEEEYLGKASDNEAVVPRVKALRMKILPDMVRGRLNSQERLRRWEQLADIYLAQQVSSYPADYLTERPSVSRFLETIERYEEDLTDRVRVHGDLKCIIQVGDAIEVSPNRDRQAAIDPLMQELETAMQSMLDVLALESPLFEEHFIQP